MDEETEQLGNRRDEVSEGNLEYLIKRVNAVIARSGRSNTVVKFVNASVYLTCETTCTMYTLSRR